MRYINSIIIIIIIIINSNSSKKFTCPSGKLITEFTSLIAKYTSPGVIRHYFLCKLQSYNKMLIDWFRLGWKGKYLVLCQDVWPRAKYFPDHTSHSVPWVPEIFSHVWRGASSARPTRHCPLAEDASSEAARKNLWRRAPWFTMLDGPRPYL